MILDLIPLKRVNCVKQIDVNKFEYCDTSYYFTLPKRPIELIDTNGNIYLDYVIDCYDNYFLTENNHNNIVKINEFITPIRINNIDISKEKIHFDYVRELLPNTDLFKKSIDYLSTNISKITKRTNTSHYEITLDLSLHIEYELKKIVFNSYQRNILMKDLYFDRVFNMNKYIIDTLLSKELIYSIVNTNYSIQPNKSLGSSMLVFTNTFVYLDGKHCY